MSRGESEKTSDENAQILSKPKFSAISHLFPATCRPIELELAYLYQLEHLLLPLQKQISDWDSVNRVSRGESQKTSDQNEQILY